MPSSPLSSPLLLLLRIHVRQSWRRLAAVRQQSRLLTAVIRLFIVGYLSLSFWLFYKGLEFIAAFPGLGSVLTERLLCLLFAFLFALLTLSNVVISYTNLFQNRETAFLLAGPAQRTSVFQWKWIESTLLASWAFLFLIAPLLAAYGLTHHVAWHFYPVTVLLMALFIILPGVLGSWIAIYLGRFFDRRSFQAAVVLGALALLAAAAFWWQVQPATDELLESRVLDVLDKLLAKTRFSEAPWLPSLWLTRGALLWADGALIDSLFFAMVLLSYAAFFGYLAFAGLGDAFYDTASAVQSRAGVRRAPKTSGPDRAPGVPLSERLLNRLGAWLDPDVRALVLKDARMFWRDTTQWGQTIMLFGLLGVYIVNLRHFTHGLTQPFWINLIAYLNLSVCSLNLATLTTRFVFPQFSLEGRRLWIIGMIPLGLRRVVMIKYWMACASSMALTLTLVTLSCWLLRLPWDQVLFFAAVITAMTLSLNGLAVGLGMLFPNFRENNPGKIVSGFGGTLCLALSFLYILASILVLAFGTAGWHSRLGWVAASVAVFLVLSFATGWIPVRLGLNQLHRIEY
ncbi:MAG: hypothetical protein U1F98_08245 [Verrucomicrobiota bacterium]